MFPLRSSLFRVSVPFDVSDGRCGIIVSVLDHCLPFYFKVLFKMVIKVCLLTHLCGMDFSTITLWTGPFPIEGPTG